MMEIFLREFFPTLIMVYLLVFLIRNDRISKNDKTTLYIVILIWVIEGFAYELELITAEWSKPTVWRTLLSVIGYTTRPLLISFSTLLLSKKHKTFKSILLYNIPCIINFLVMSTAFFSPIAFTYTQSNSFARGPLGRFPAIIMVYYFVMLIYIAHKNASFSKTREKIVLVLITSSIIVTTLFDMYGYVTGRFREVTILCLLIYFILLQNRILNHSADYDMLTGLLSRRATMQEVETYINSHHLNQSNALLMIDIDHFKEVNDTLGHQIGDTTLVEFAHIMQDTFPKNAISGRIGGDEFFTFIKDIERAELEDLINEFITKAILTHSDDHNVVMTTASIGIAMYVDDGKSDVSLNKLYKQADDALYESKARGRNTYTFAK